MMEPFLFSTAEIVRFVDRSAARFRDHAVCALLQQPVGSRCRFGVAFALVVALVLAPSLPL